MSLIGIAATLPVLQTKTSPVEPVLLTAQVPAPILVIIHLNPVGKPAGTVTLAADALVTRTTSPESPAASV
jgi:hypothetical protein